MTESVGTFQMAGLRFAAACSYRASGETGRTRQKMAIEAAVASGVDPDEMMRLIERHRIQATAWDTLSRLGLESVLGDYAHDLREQAREVRATSLSLAMAQHGVCKALTIAGIEVFSLKGGPELSRQLYGDIGLRQCKDLDLIVPVKNVRDATEYLKSVGWKAKEPVWTSTRFHLWICDKLLKDLSFFHPSTGVLLELHFRFERIPDLVKEQLWWNEYRTSKCENVSANELAFLCLHGAMHCWSRMKWLGDIAAVLDRDPGAIDECMKLPVQLELASIFPHIQELLHVLFGFENIKLIGDDKTRQQVSFCLKSLVIQERSGIEPMEAKIIALNEQAYVRRSFHGRYAKRLRWKNAIVKAFLRTGDIEALGRFWGFVLFLPVIRVFSFFVRYARIFLSPIATWLKRER